MITIRPSAARGSTQIDWLDSKHSFSFCDYRDPAHMGFGPLRVINDDKIGPAGGFGTHPHHDMEILTYVLSGQLEHRDSMGTGSIIEPGDAQRMTAGTGVYHSEFNPSRTQGVHLLQIWLFPTARGLTPEYEQRAFSEAQKRNQLCVIAGPKNGNHQGLSWHQSALLYATKLEAGFRLDYQPPQGRGTWIQVATGAIKLNGQELRTGDGAMIQNEANLSLEGVEYGDMLLFDLPLTR